MSISNSALPPAPAQVETLPALPRGLLTLFTGEDGHLYLAEGDGVSTTRLTWSPEDFAPIPGIPFFPGLTEELEDELVFAHPTISADGQRVAAFALQPTLIDEADILDGDFDDEDEFAVVVDDLEGAFAVLEEVPWYESEGILAADDKSLDDIAGAGMVVAVVEGDEVVGEDELEEEDDGDPDGESDASDLLTSDGDDLPLFWPGCKLFVVHRDGVQVWEVWSKETGTPIHHDWAPDQRHLLVLHQDQGLLSLEWVDSRSEEEPRVLATGAPLFWSWRPGSCQFAIRRRNPERSSAVVQLIDPAGSGSTLTLGPAGSFYAPAWHPQGDRLAYAVQAGEEDQLVVLNPETRTVQTLFAYPGRGAFRWDPQGRRIALGVAPEGRGPLRLLELIDTQTGESKTLWHNAFLAADWLPDGSGLVLAQVEDGGKLQWVTVNLDGTSRALGGPFLPTRETILSLHFFEQVANSHPFLSDDGAYLVVAGYPDDEPLWAGPEGLDDPELKGEEPAPRILITPIGGGPSIAVGLGRYACFGGARP